MEFRFNLNEIFKEPFVEIGNSLIPPGFAGDKRTLWDTQSKITQIVNAMGEASAHAQGLSKPITTADRLRNSEHKLYLLLDQSANNGKGAVTGMLKTGEKGLYVFDREGQHYQVSPPCVLDFYVHESRQRAGYGKGLFEHMLQRQQIEPVKMAIDRPSDKLLGFLNKHYGLNTPVKQMNNFVVYDGFFPRSSETRAIDTEKSYTPGKKQSANGLQHGIPSSPYGRYGAPRPPCSMGQIIHNDTAVIKRNQEPTGVRSEPFTNASGQHYIYNSNQQPAWLATQSVPNMPYSCPPNQQYYTQNQLPPYPTPTVQYPQYQQFVQNQNATQYPPSSGDHGVEQQMQQSMQQNQMLGAPMINQDNQNAMQEYQQAYYNYTMGQGDATCQSYKDQDGIVPAEGHIQGQNPDQSQHQQVVRNQNEIQEEQGHQNQDVVQGQPQMFTYQGQTYCYNPQTQQYHMVPNENQQNFVPNVSQNQPVYYNQSPLQSDTQRSQSTPYGQQHHREPLRPQHLDGTVRRVQQSVSMPVPVTKTHRNQNVMVHGTASAPVYYQRQQVMAGHPHNPGLGQAFDTTPVPRTVAQSENLVNAPNQGVVGQPQHQENIQNQSMHQIANPPQPGDQSAVVQPSANTDNMAYATENMTQASRTIAQVPLVAQGPQAAMSAPRSQINTPRNVNVNVMAQSPRGNQPLNVNQAPVQQDPVVQQVVADAQNLNVQHQQQPNMAYSQMALHNQAVNPYLAHQTQSVERQGGYKNAGPTQPVNIQNVAPAVESTHSRIHNVASSQVSPPIVKPIVPQANNQPQMSEMENQGRQHIQKASAMTQGQTIYVPQQQQPSQHQIMHQYRPLDHQPHVAKQQALMGLDQNETMVVGQQSSSKQSENQQYYQHFGHQPQQIMTNGNQNVAGRQQPKGLDGIGDERNKAPRNLASTTKCNAGQERHMGGPRGDEECDITKGYPPQHHERPAQHSTPKADRPQSLNIETAENLEMMNHRHEAEAEIPEAEAEAHELLDGNYEDGDSLDGEQNDLGIEEDIEKIDIAPKETTPHSKGSRSPGIEAAGIVTPGRNTPGLTGQGYFDLKFYHNKLW